MSGNEKMSVENQMWREWYDRTWEDAKAGVNYLFLVHSGAIVGLLGFLGSFDSDTARGTYVVPLALFLGGLIAVGLLKAALLHKSRSFNLLIVSRLKREIDDSEFWSGIEAREDYLLLFILGYGSFGCFVIGIGVGAIELASS